MKETYGYRDGSDAGVAGDSLLAIDRLCPTVDGAPRPTPWTLAAIQQVAQEFSPTANPATRVTSQIEVDLSNGAVIICTPLEDWVDAQTGIAQAVEFIQGVK